MFKLLYSLQSSEIKLIYYNFAQLYIKRLIKNYKYYNIIKIIYHQFLQIYKPKSNKILQTKHVQVSFEQ